MNSTKTLSVLLALLIVLLHPLSVRTDAQYPSRSIKCLVPYPPGGLPDTVARVVARRLQERLGQPVFVENRPGANGAIAASALTNAAADGYTMMVSDGAVVSINPAIYAALTYKPEYIQPVALLARAPLFLAVHAKVPVATMGEFIDYAKAHPGQLNYGTAGIGSIHHLTMEVIKTTLHLDMIHVPFKGTADAVAALLGGHVDAAFAAYPTLSGAADGKQIKLLATNGAQRSPQAPDLPTVSEFIPNFDFAPLVGIYVRDGTPSAVVSRLADEAVAIVREAEVAAQLAAIGVETDGAGTEEFKTSLARETQRVAKAVQTAGLEPR
jgi:tripartite-type tricarboxylate transporter receptor subunit TctC